MTGKPHSCRLRRDPVGSSFSSRDASGDGFCPSGDGSCPSDEDSVYLGEALEKIWFLEENPTTYRETACAEFETRLLEVSKRSPHMKVKDWGYENGLLVRDEEELEDPYGVAELKWID